jgi:serine/threonine protein kinase
MMGTVDYMAPEQAIDAHNVDIRGDIYRLGCTLFYLLTGQAPFQGGTESEKLVRHQMKLPPIASLAGGGFGGRL